MDLAAALVALDLDPDDPSDFDDVAVVHALVARRGLVRARPREACTRPMVAGAEIRRASEPCVAGPEVPWQRACRRG